MTILNSFKSGKIYQFLSTYQFNYERLGKDENFRMNFQPECYVAGDCSYTECFVPCTLYIALKPPAVRRIYYPPAVQVLSNGSQSSPGSRKCLSTLSVERAVQLCHLRGYYRTLTPTGGFYLIISEIMIILSCNVIPGLEYFFICCN